MSGQLEFGEEDRSATLQRAWEQCLILLASKISTVPLETYIRPTRPLEFDGTTVTLGVNSSFLRDRLEQKFANAIRSALEFHLEATGLTIRFVVLTRQQQSENAAHRREEAQRAAEAQTILPLGDEEPDIKTVSLSESRLRSTPGGGGRPTSSKRSETKPAIPTLPINDRFLFENFHVGSRSNRLAFASAEAVAAKPGEIYNPLFLYGAPGLGKTHLLHAIANSLRKTHPHLRVAYVSGEFFAQQYVQSLRDHATEEFRRQYREVDVWLVDDIQFIQFIAGKGHTKEEFFHTFNTLYQNKAQIVIASDRSPRELNALDERLRSRFQSGLIADINPPEIETRVAYLQSCCNRENAIVPQNVIDYVADAIQSNMRTLEGAVTRLVAYSSIMKTAISPELAQSVLTEYFIGKPAPVKRLTVDTIIDIVAGEFGASSEAIKGRGRNKEIALARHVAMYLCRELLPEINTTFAGAAFGGRDHATIVYAYQRIRALIEVDPEMKGLMGTLRTKLSD